MTRRFKIPSRWLWSVFVAAWLFHCVAEEMKPLGLVRERLKTLQASSSTFDYALIPPIYLEFGS